MEIVEEPMSVYVGFSKPKNRIPVIGYLFSWAIRLVEWSPFSHNYVRWFSRGAQVDVVYEASGTKVHFSSKKRVFDHKVHVVKEYELKITRAQYRKLLHFCMTNAGLDYGLLGAIGILWPKIGKIFGKKWTNPWVDGDYSWFCNELGGSAIENMKDVDIDIDLESTGPKALDEWLSRYSEATLVKG